MKSNKIKLTIEMAELKYRNLYHDSIRHINKLEYTLQGWKKAKEKGVVKLIKGRIKEEKDFLNSFKVLKTIRTSYDLTPNRLNLSFRSAY